MAFKIPKNTLICIGILIAVLVGLYFAGFLNKEKLPKFLQEDYENEDSDDSEDEEEDDDEDWKNITEEDLLEMA